MYSEHGLEPRIGAVLGPLVVTFFVETLDQSWRWSYVALLGLEAVVLACFWLTLTRWTLPTEKHHYFDTDDQPVKSTSVGILETLRAPMVWMGLVIFFLYGGVEIGTGQLANNLFVEGRGIAQGVAGFWVSVYWGSFTVGRMLSSIYAERLRIHSLVRLSMMGMMGGAVLFWLNIGGLTGFWGLALLGFAQAPIFPMLTTDTPRRVGTRYAPNTIGFQLGMTAFGGALLPGLAAMLAVRIDLEVIGLVVTVSTVALYMLYEGMLWQEANRKKKKRQLHPII